MSWCTVFHIVICSLLVGGSFVVTAKRPHIVIILADDLGWDDVSFHGSPQIPTRNIDALAHNSIILNNYYVSPICTPTRSALMTGRYPIHNGMQHGVLIDAEPRGLPLNETLMPEYLNKLGYISHIVGKWHLGFASEAFTPTKRGFQTHFGFYQGMEDYYLHLAGRQISKCYKLKASEVVLRSEARA